MKYKYPETLRATEAAKYLGVSASLLAKLRMRHRRTESPPFAKIGGRVVYRRSDLDNWLDARTLSMSMSEVTDDDKH
ncbi:MAG: helix-turn-helix transcriptional regulator [Pseudooceanicola sp.]